MNKHVHIRDLDGEDHEALTQMARDKKMSLSEFLRTELHKVAQRPKLAQALERLKDINVPNLTSEEVVRIIREEREEQTDRILAATSLAKRNKP